MTEVKLSFIKKRFASVAAATAASTATQGLIVFDKQNKVICVDGDMYGGNIQDVNYNDQTNELVITKANGTTQTLSFADVASASQTMAVFGQLRDTIGITDAIQGVQGHYTNTNYLQGAQTLIAADNALDSQIHTVQGHVQGVQGSLEALQGALADVAFTGKAEDVEIDPVTYGGVTLQGTDGSTAKNVQDALEGMLQGVIDKEQVTEAAFEAVQGAVGLNSDLQFPSHSNANFIQGATNVDEALVALDEAVHGISSAGEVTVTPADTPTTGYLKTYEVKQGGTTVGTIDIPKDFLVKSASVQEVTTADTPYSGAAVGDKYIDFVINTKETAAGSETATHVYLPVNDLVDTYTAEQNAAQVQLAISSTNEISAAIVQGSIDHWALQDGAVQTAKIAAQGVTSEKIAAQGVEGWNIKDGAVDTDQLADGAVTTEKIAAQGVTSEKIGVQAVQGWNIAQGAITSDKLAAEFVDLPENTPNVIVNNDAQNYDGEKVATIAGQDIKVMASMYWTEWSDADPT